MRRVISATLLLGSSVALLNIFIVMWIQNSVGLHEPHSIIRISETILFGLMSLFALHNLLKEIGG